MCFCDFLVPFHQTFGFVEICIIENFLSLSLSLSLMRTISLISHVWQTWTRHGNVRDVG